MLADYHVHSNFSDDSDYPMESVCHDAVRLNLDEICFTDHVDYGVKPDHDDPTGARVENGLPVLNVDYDHYFPELERVREEFAGDLVVRCGMEFGVQVHTEPRFRALYEAHVRQWDFLILSIHQVGDLEFWMGDFQRGRTQKDYNDAYYQELYDVVTTFSDYSVLGHLDLIRRYDPAGPYPFERNRDIIAAILERVIADGRGIEVNTSSFRYGLDDLQPSTDILRLYHDLGGRIVTIGSDSHKPEHLGSYIRLVQRRLVTLGYTEFCTFDHLEPVFHELG